MEQHGRIAAAAAGHHRRVLREAGPLFGRAAGLQSPGKQARAGELGDRRQRGYAGPVERPAGLAEGQPLVLRQVGQQFPADRHAHAVDDDHQHRVVGGQGSDDLVQDPLHRHYAVTLGAGGGPVHQEPGEAVGLLLADLGHHVEQPRIGFGEHLDGVARPQAEPRPVHEPAILQMFGRGLSQGPGFGGALLAPFAQPAHQPHGHVHPLQPPCLAGGLIVVADRLPGLDQVVECVPPLAGQHAAQALTEAGQPLVEADGRRIA